MREKRGEQGKGGVRVSNVKGQAVSRGELDKQDSKA